MPQPDVAATGLTIMPKTTSQHDFEVWAAPRGYYLARWMDGYANWDVQQMFIGWSARDALIQSLYEQVQRLEAADGE